MGMVSSAKMLGRSFGSRLRLTLYFVFTWLGVVLLLAFLLNEGRREAEQKAPSGAMSVTSLVEARLGATMRLLQGRLEHMAASLPRDAFGQTAVVRYREAVVGELGLYSRQFPEASRFRVMDAAGNLLYSFGDAQQPGSFPSRSFLDTPMGKPGNSLYFSEVVVDRSSGRSSLFVIRPAADAQGGILGFVSAQLDIDALKRMCATTDVGSRGIVAVWRVDDGRFVMGWPGAPDRINRALDKNPLHQRIVAGERQGTLRLPALLDSVERVYAFQRIADSPLYVVSGLAVADYLAEWRQTVGVAAVLALLLFLSLSLVLIRLLRTEDEEVATAGKLAESEARYRMLAENSHDVIWTLDITSRRYTYVSPAIADMCGYLPEDMVGQSIDARLPPESAARLAREIDQRLRRIAAGDKAASVVVSELELVCKDGEVISTEVVSSYLQDTDGVAHTILGITRNVSERKAAELALRETNRQLHARIEEIGRLQVALQELAVRDSLTGLYNRRYLDETLEREVSRARREGNPLSLVMLDIDYFKLVNDTYGHQVGDEALRMLASTLLADVRTEDVVCRYGGEEFLVLLPNMPLDAAIQRAEVWRAAIEELSLLLGNFRITFTISLGVTAYPEHGKTPDDLTRCVDQALYRAKNEGRNRICVFSA